MTGRRAGERKLPPLIEEYFSLDSYKDCAKWGLREWVVAARARRSRRYLLDDRLKGKWLKQPPTFILESPLDRYIKDPVGGVTWSDPLPKSGLREISTDYICGLTKDISESDMLSGNNFVLTDVVRLLRGTKTAYLEVDLSLSDKLLISKFKSWLGSIRGELDQHPNVALSSLFDDNDFSRWRIWKILPYIDLVSWNRANMSPLNDAAIKETLELDSLTTTKEKVVKFLSEENISAMEKQLEWVLS